MKKVNIKKFIKELNLLSKKYDLILESTDILFLSSDDGDINLYYDFKLNEYITYKD